MTESDKDLNEQPIVEMILLNSIRISFPQIIHAATRKHMPDGYTSKLKHMVFF
jgi:hypothetical protein